MAAEGKGLARHDGKVIFVDYGIPGDTADIRLLKNKKDYAAGVIETLHGASPLRQEPFCEHFGTCGGCRWQHISYRQQLSYKEHIVEEAFRRTGKQAGFELRPIAGCAQTTGYRNKFEFTFSNRGWFTSDRLNSGEALEWRALGFHVAGQYQKVVHVNYCHLQEASGNAIRNAIFEFVLEKGWPLYNQFRKEGLLRTMFMRYTSTGERMIVVCFGEDDREAIEALMSFIRDKFPDIDSIQYIVNRKFNDSIYDLDVECFAGKDHIIEQFGEIRYRIGPKSFFQTNSSQARMLYDLAVSAADIRPDDTVYDLYTGIGSIALYIANRAGRVVGVETVPEAIEDANINAALNGIGNVEFIAGSSERVLDREFLEQHGRPDVLITDPPRSGMHEDVTDFILEAAPRRVVYISCNPVTQARDVLRLSAGYKLVSVQPVDMFPHTYHIESIAVLDRV